MSTTPGTDRGAIERGSPEQVARDYTPVADCFGYTHNPLFPFTDKRADADPVSDEACFRPTRLDTRQAEDTELGISEISDNKVFLIAVSSIALFRTSPCPRTRSFLTVKMPPSIIAPRPIYTCLRPATLLACLTMDPRRF